MAIEQRGYSYRIRVRDLNGDRVTETLTGTARKPASKKKAQEREAELMRAIKNYEYHPEDNLTVLQLWKVYVEETHVKQKQLKDYKSLFKNHILPVLGGVPVKAISVGHVRKMVNRSLKTRFDNRKAPPKQENAKKALMSLQMLFNWGVENDKISRNPIKDRTKKVIPKEEDEDKSVRVYAQDREIDVYLDYAKNWRAGRHYNALYIAATTGIRASEITNLKWEDVNLDIKIPTMSIGNKSISSHRVLQLDKVQASLLEDHRLKMSLLYYKKLGRSEMPDDYVFCNPHTLRKYYKDVYSKIFARLAKEILNEQQLPDFKGHFDGDKWVRKLTLHWLRHYHASVLIKNGISPKQVQERLGHADVSLTLRTYVKLWENFDIESSKVAVSRLKLPELLE